MEINYLYEYNKNDTGYFIDYNNEISHLGFENIIDLRDIINREIDRWVEEIINIKVNILQNIDAKKDYKYLLSINRINLWRSNEKFSIKPLIYYLALKKIKKNKINLLNAPEDLKKLISEEFENVNYKSEIFIIFYIRLLLRLIKILYCKIRYLEIRKINNRIIVFTSVLNKEIFNKKGDHYFGNLFDSIKDDVTWVYDDIKNPHSDRKDNYINILELISLKNILNAFIDNIKIRVKNRKNFNNNSYLSIDGIKTKYFYKKIFTELVLNDILILEIALLNSLDRLFSNKNLEIYYPYEEKSIERSILLAAKNKKIRCNAFAHAVYTRGHFHLQRHDKDRSPRPNRLLICGDYTEQLFLKFGVPKNQLIMLGSPRHSIQNLNYQKSKKLRLLLLVGHGFEFIIFSSWLASNPSISINHEVKIRKYPFGWNEEQEYAEFILKKNKIDYSLSSENLKDDVLKSDLLLFESTSAAFEGGLLGRLILKINISELVKTKHINENLNNEIEYCKNPEELLTKLKEIQNMNQETLIRKIAVQREYIENYYKKLNLDVIK